MDQGFALRRVQEVESSLGSGLGVVLEADELLPGAIEEEHTAPDIGEADEVRAVFKGRGQTVAIALGLAALGDVDEQAGESDRMARGGVAGEETTALGEDPALASVGPNDAIVGIVFSRTLRI